MSLLNHFTKDSLPTMAGLNKSKDTSPKAKKDAKYPCTVFCDPKGECPKHHELVLTLTNCNDCLGERSNILQFQKCVVKCIDEGWDKHDVVPDPTQKLRLPLVHLACAMGKCQALEWLLQYGFNPNVKCQSTGQFPLHRAICDMYRTGAKFSASKVIPKLNRMMNAMPKQLVFHDEINGDTPLHVAATLLTTLDSKSLYFQVGIFSF